LLGAAAYFGYYAYIWHNTRSPLGYAFGRQVAQQPAKGVAERGPNYRKGFDTSLKRSGAAEPVRFDAS
jgi:hypothetical protein